MMLPLWSVERYLTNLINVVERQLGLSICTRVCVMAVYGL